MLTIFVIQSTNIISLSTYRVTLIFLFSKFQFRDFEYLLLNIILVMVYFNTTEKLNCLNCRTNKNIVKAFVLVETILDQGPEDEDQGPGSPVHYKSNLKCLVFSQSNRKFWKKQRILSFKRMPLRSTVSSESSLLILGSKKLVPDS